MDNSPYPDVIYCSEKNTFISIALNNYLYEEVLDKINEEGTDCFTGDIPAKVQKDADDKKEAD